MAKGLDRQNKMRVHRWVSYNCDPFKGLEAAASITDCLLRSLEISDHGTQSTQQQPYPNDP